MAIQIITPEDLEHFRIQLLNDLRDLFSKSQNSEEKKYLRGNEVRKLLKISNGTLQNLRATNILHPTKIGGSFYYNLDEIQSILNGK